MALSRSSALAAASRSHLEAPAIHDDFVSTPPDRAILRVLRQRGNQLPEMGCLERVDLVGGRLNDELRGGHGDSFATCRSQA